MTLAMLLEMPSFVSRPASPRCFAALARSQDCSSRHSFLPELRLLARPLVILPHAAGAGALASTGPTIVLLLPVLADAAASAGPTEVATLSMREALVRIPAEEAIGTQAMRANSCAPALGAVPLVILAVWTVVRRGIVHPHLAIQCDWRRHRRHARIFRHCFLIPAEKINLNHVGLSKIIFSACLKRPWRLKPMRQRSVDALWAVKIRTSEIAESSCNSSRTAFQASSVVENAPCRAACNRHALTASRVSASLLPTAQTPPSPTWCTLRR
jgi:hypothetical protein